VKELKVFAIIVIGFALETIFVESGEGIESGYQLLRQH